MGTTEAQRYVWEGAIPLQIHLHDSEITTLPSPPPALILGPRIGYLQLLVTLIKPYFSTTLPPGVDTVWFDYKGLPLKWYIPTGVLFDLLCVEPERPWNLTVHFRGYPGDLLTPCDGEESIKWSFINSLKEASYIINGNCKNIMNMSQPDQLELWRSVINGNMEGYFRISSKLRLGTSAEEYATKAISDLTQPRQTTSETDISGSSRTGRVPVRLYVRYIDEAIGDLTDVPSIDSWDEISYINRPVEILREDGKIFTLHDALKTLLPEFFEDEPSIDEEISLMELKDASKTPDTDSCNQDSDIAVPEKSEVSREIFDKPHAEDSGRCSSRKPDIKFVRVQGIKPKFDIPFNWLVKNLMYAEHFIHICVYVGRTHD